MRGSKFKNIMTFASVVALPLALCAAFAEARGTGVTNESLAARTVMAGRGHVAASRGHVAASQASSPAPGGTILAERVPVLVPASEAQKLIAELQEQLKALPEANLTIGWQLTRPAADN